MFPNTKYVGGKSALRGDLEEFKELSLSDEEKRGIYGEDALKERMGMGGGRPFYPFNGGGGTWLTRGEDRFRNLMVSLEELYHGTTKKLSVPHNTTCDKCKGKGFQGWRHFHFQMSWLPGYWCESYNPANWNGYDSTAAGNVSYMQRLRYEDRCSQCKGNKITSAGNKVLEVNIEKGMQDGQKITFQGQADEAPGKTTGDVIVVLQQKRHPKFEREHDDLYVQHRLSLAEALYGFEFVLTHLDGRKLIIKSNPAGEVIKPDQYKVMDDEGMPRDERKGKGKGNLLVHFKVDFPNSAGEWELEAMKRSTHRHKR